MAGSANQCHFVLVHGGCHGAWCWYKAKPALESQGRRVTAVDLTASGMNMSKLEEIKTLRDYSRPALQVLETIGDDERVVIVGHSLGGPVTALAMDEFPKKISAGVFLTAFMPDTTNPPAYVMDKALTMSDFLIVDKFVSIVPPVNPLIPPVPEIFKTLRERAAGDVAGHRVWDLWWRRQLMWVLLGPKYLETSMYQLCPVEDLALAKMLVRTGPMLPSIVAGGREFTAEGYGSVKRVFIVCKDDDAVYEEHQRWMVDNFPVAEVMEIEGADHTPMFFKPKQVCELLVEVSRKYA